MARDLRFPRLITDSQYISDNPDYRISDWNITSPLVAHGVLSPRSQYYSDFARSRIRPGARNAFKSTWIPPLAELDALEQEPIAHKEQLDHDVEDETFGQEDTESESDMVKILDGGYGWIIVLCAAISTFWMNSIMNTWGVVQLALLSSTAWSTSILAFVGSLQLALGPAFGLLFTRLNAAIGSRATAMLGIVLMSLGLFVASFFTTSIPALFICLGFISGTGISGVYAATNALPVQYFTKRLGLAIGLIKLGGGVGGAVMAVILGVLFPKVGIPATFRVQALITLTGLPVAWFLRDRVRWKNSSFIDLAMFRDLTFSVLFAAGAITVFALFVPLFYLPLLANTLGYSGTTGALLVATFNISSATGRLLGGIMCDKVGSSNTFLLLSVLNALTMLILWPLSASLAPLIIFAILNGLANGAFFTVYPTVVAKVTGPEKAPMALSMSVTGFTPGYLLGTPIAGYLLPGSTMIANISSYHAAMFYAGGIAAIGAVLSICARLLCSSQVLKRV